MNIGGLEVSTGGMGEELDGPGMVGVKVESLGVAAELLEVGMTAFEVVGLEDAVLVAGSVVVVGRSVTPCCWAQVSRSKPYGSRISATVECVDSVSEQGDTYIRTAVAIL